MGFLGLCLLFVGIALLMNGVAAISKWDAKTTAFINIAKAGGADTMAFNNTAAGFLFGFTYLFIAANCLWKLDLRAFGWYSVCVAVFAAISAVACFDAGSVPMGVLWTAWAVLWLEGFLELGLRIGALGKIFPALSILEGIFATGGPGILMLFGLWPV
jgi:acid-activated urea channel